MTWRYLKTTFLGNSQNHKNPAISMFPCFSQFSFLGSAVIFGKLILVFGKIFGNVFGELLASDDPEKRDATLVKKGYKGRCEKRSLSKSKEVVKTYSAIQYAYADILQGDEAVAEIQCNVFLDGLPEGKYTSDFVCIKVGGDLMVRECVY